MGPTDDVVGDSDGDGVGEGCTLLFPALASVAAAWTPSSPLTWLNSEPEPVGELCNIGSVTGSAVPATGGTSEANKKWVAPPLLPSPLVGASASAAPGSVVVAGAERGVGCSVAGELTGVDTSPPPKELDASVVVAETAPASAAGSTAPAPEANNNGPASAAASKVSNGGGCGCSGNATAPPSATAAAPRVKSTEPCRALCTAAGDKLTAGGTSGPGAAAAPLCCGVAILLLLLLPKEDADAAAARDGGLGSPPPPLLLPPEAAAAAASASLRTCSNSGGSHSSGGSNPAAADSSVARRCALK